MPLYLSWDCAYKTLAYALINVNEEYLKIANETSMLAKKIIEKAKILGAIIQNSPDSDNILRASGQDNKDDGNADQTDSSRDNIEQYFAYVDILAKLVKIMTGLCKKYITIIDCNEADVLGDGIKLSDTTPAIRAQKLMRYLETNNTTNMANMANMASMASISSLNVRVLIETQPMNTACFRKPTGSRTAAAFNKKSNDVAQSLMTYYSSTAYPLQVTNVSSRKKNRCVFGGHKLKTTTAAGQKLSPSAAYLERKKHAVLQLEWLNKACNFGLSAKKVKSANIADAVLQCLAVHFKI